MRRFLAPWLERGHYAAAEDGEPRWLTRDGGHILWHPEPAEGAKSVAFIRASIYDNKILLAKDPGYLANLKAMSLVDRRRLLDGDWDIVEAGNMFDRAWFKGPVEAAPAEGRDVRFWDMASTEPTPGRDPDWAVGVRMRRTPEVLFYILDVQRARTTPLRLSNLILQTAALDGKSVPIRMEQEPGSSGVTVIDAFTRRLAGYDFRGLRSTGDKAERAKPYSAQVEAGNVFLVAGPWNNDFLNEHPPFPSPSVHDDQVDAASGAMQFLTEAPTWGADPETLRYLANRK